MIMLEPVIEFKPQREDSFIKSVKSRTIHSMKDRLDEIAKNHSQVSAYTIYEKPRTEDEGVYDKKGYIDEAWLASVLPTTDAACYYCGPTGFMNVVHEYLKNLGVAREDIHYEVFGSEVAITF